MYVRRDQIHAFTPTHLVAEASDLGIRGRFPEQIIVPAKVGSPVSFLWAGNEIDRRENELVAVEYEATVFGRKITLRVFND